MSVRSCFSDRTLFEKFLLFLVVLFFFIIVISIIYLGLNKSDQSQNAQQNVCLNKACINAASSILNSIDDTVSPCQDFYQFSCGNWIKSNVIPPGKRSWSMFTELRRENFRALKTVLESKMSSTLTSRSTEWKVKQLYWSCMDLDGHKEKLDIKPILPYIQTLQGWTISSIGDVKFNESAPWSLQDLLQRVFSIQGTEIFELNVYGNVLKPSTNMLWIGPSVPLNKELLTNKKIEAYKKYLFDLGMMLGGEENYTKQIVEEVFELEIELSNISESKSQLRQDDTNVTIKHVNQLQQDYPFIEWLTFLRTFFKPFNITINNTEPVRIISSKYFEKLTLLLNEKKQTDKGKRQIQNYVTWRKLFGFANLLSYRFRKLADEYTKVVTGVVGAEGKDKKCFYPVEDYLYFGLGAMFVKNNFKSESKVYTKEIIDKIKEAFIMNLSSLTWMNNKSRSSAIQKANAMQSLIGYPDFILNNTLLDEFYKEHNIQEKKYFENIMNMKKAVKKIELSKLRKINDKSEWETSPSDVNAFYSQSANLMIFPAGILQGSFFNKDLPDWANYGAIGFVAGHELTHGFDDHGSQYDSEGILRQWWDDQVREKFDNKTQCFVDQYSKYKISGKEVKGRLTLGENIADNGGLKSAYSAYLRLNKKQPTLPGVPYNDKQLFFLSMSKLWCSIETKTAAEHFRVTDSHSSNKFRVIGSVSNFPEFSKVFNCPLGSAMNPEKKCEVW